MKKMTFIALGAVCTLLVLSGCGKTETASSSTSYFSLEPTTSSTGVLSFPSKGEGTFKVFEP